MNRRGTTDSPRLVAVPTSFAAVALAALFLLAACDPAHPVTSAPAPSEHTLDGSPSTTSGPVSDTDWPTYHHDNARTGVAPGFPTVGTLHPAWTARLDGAVYGQPIVVGDTLYAATEHDTVYALAPDTGTVKWSRHLGEPMPKSQLPCGNIDPLGITSTMAYDPTTGLVFALAESVGAHHTLYGLDAGTGAVRVTRAAEPPKGDPVAHQQRSALTVLGNQVYIAYGGLAGDCANYIGSVVAIPITGSGAAVSYAVPTPREGGIWTPGGANVHNGQLLYVVGNGESSKTYDGSDSVIALDSGLALKDRFAPSVWADDNDRDLDLGSMTAAVVNGYVLIAGKRGVGYALRADHLGGIGGEVDQAPVCKAFGGAAVDGTTAYVPCQDGGVRAVQVDSSGKIHVLWHAQTDAAGSPVVGGGAVWVIDYDGGDLYALDPASGAVRQKIAVGTAPHFASPTLAKGRVYIGTLTGVVAIAPN